MVVAGDALQGVGAGGTQVAELGGKDQPFGLAQRGFLHIVADIYKNIQFASLPVTTVFSPVTP